MKADLLVERIGGLPRGAGREVDGASPRLVRETNRLADELLAGTLAPRCLIHDDVFDPGAHSCQRTEDDERQRADDLAVGAAGQEDRRGG